MSYSGGGGGTITLPSPTHPHRVDATSIARTIRRSLSRSPSKFKLVTKSPSPTPKSPLSPSPPKRQSSQTFSIFGTPNNAPHTPSPLAVPFPPSAKLALRSSTRSSAKAAPPRPSSRTRTSPKSPAKRALSQTSDSGNSAPSSSQSSAGGQENGRISAERRSFERTSKMETSGPLNYALSRLGGDGAGDTQMTSTTSSPLKRSDAIMNLDQASLGSPVAKRRSLHGSASFGHDFNVFDHGPAAPTSNFDIHDDTNTNQGYELSTASNASDNPLAFTATATPRRSSSLRKSTLQQRHGEKTSWGRRAAANALAAQMAANTASGSEPSVSTPTHTKNRPRLSLDQFMPPMQRESPFSRQEPLPNPSAHLMNPPEVQSHPLSHEFTSSMPSSSSSSSVADDSPTHVPVNFNEKPKSKLDFSRSLPVGALRTFAAHLSSRTEEAFATPENYKNVKPHAAAFASTGLISKVNMNPEEPQLVRGKAIPDTPCKKQPNIFATYPSAPMPGSALQKARHVRHSFGTPSTPFNVHGTTPAQGLFGSESGSIFGAGLQSRASNRRGSFLAAEVDENFRSGSQSTDDYDPPPTPTKQALLQQDYQGSPTSHRSFPPSASGLGFTQANKASRTSSKLNNSIAEAEDSDGSADNASPSVVHVNRKFTDSTLLANRARNQRAKNHLSMPLLPTTPASYLSSNPPKSLNFTKVSDVASVSPLQHADIFARLASPRTPAPYDSMVPPDPSGLTISKPRNTSSTFMLPPATPTTGRDHLIQPVTTPRMSTTPTSNFGAVDIDDCLSSRFEKVEYLGGGNFSQVYKATKITPQSSTAQLFLNSRSPASMMTQCYAVKKTLQPYGGLKDRTKKWQEVNILKALGKSDYVVNFVDCWEANLHLYIQTEFCDEGSLDGFLNRAGNRGRIDDFRIWKIALELGKGLQHIHDSGYVHCDLKPANILITFEGVLKIADFGLASSWPVPPNHDAEGDVVYIAPEVMQGRMDKPADIFSLAMMMVEIAGNVALPKQGDSWTQLRSGDPSVNLTNASDDVVPRDATGTLISVNIDDDDESFDADVTFSSPSARRVRSTMQTGQSFSHDAANLFGTVRTGELHKAPLFMKDPQHSWSMDNLVRAMLCPNPKMRPTILQVLQSGGLQWVESRRRAGATVFEGNWGPADELLADDAEMMDV